MKMWNFDKIKRLFSFERIVGYMTIIGSMAAVCGLKKIAKLTIELKPIIEVIQNKQKTIDTKIVKDTITLIHRDTVIIIKKEIHKDTIVKYMRDTIPNSPNYKEKLDEDEKRYRQRHNLPY